MAKLTADDRGPGLNIGMWIMFVPTAMMVAAKIYTKWHTTKKIGADDVLIGIAFLMAIAQSIAITEEIKFGLGRREATLLDGDMNKLLVAQYISNIFFVISIYASKLSTAFFFTGLCRTETAKHVVSGTIWSMVLWLLISVVSLLSQCHLPHPWDSFGPTCINLKVFWTFSLVIDVITQTVIALLPIYLLSGLHISNKSSKWLVMLVFVTNLIVVPLAILRLLFLFHATDSSDYTWESLTFGILTSFQPFVSIMVTSLPFVKPILDSLILQPYLIAVEEPQSIIPGNSKGFSWAQRIQGSSISWSQKLPRGTKSYGSRTENSVHWPYTQSQEEDSGYLANPKGQGFDMGNYTSVSGKKAKMERDGVVGREVENDRVGSADNMVIRQIITATVDTK